MKKMPAWLRLTSEEYAIAFIENTEWEPLGFASFTEAYEHLGGFGICLPPAIRAAVAKQLVKEIRSEEVQS